MTPSGPSALWRREIKDAEKRLHKEMEKKLSRALFDARMTDQRNPKDGSVKPAKVSKHATDNTLRAINDRLMLGTNVVDTRVLGGSPTDDTLRSVDFEHIRFQAVTGSKIRGSDRAGGNDDSLRAVQNPHIGNAQITRSTVAAGTVSAPELSDTLNNPGVNVFGLRTLSGGTSLAASSANHGHASVNFKRDYTLQEKKRTVRMRKTVEDLADARLDSATKAIRDLLLDLAHQLIDEVDERADVWVDKLEHDPEFAHHWKMENDPDYYAEHMVATNPAYAERAKQDPTLATGHWRNSFLEHDQSDLKSGQGTTKPHWRDVEAAPRPREVSRIEATVRRVGRFKANLNTTERT